MSRIFYDRLIVLEEIEVELKQIDMSSEERQEMEHLIDETIHHRVLDRLLTHLPRVHHDEFLEKFHQTPYDEGLLDYLNQRIDESVEEHIKDEVGKLKKEILDDLKASKKDKGSK